MNTVNTVFVDDRIGSKELARSLTRAGLKTKILRLHCADFVFEGNGPAGPVKVGIERKKLNELVNAITDSDRFKEQLKKMVRAYDYCYVVVEGQHFAGRDGELRINYREAGFTRQRWTWETFEHFLTSIDVQGNLLVAGTNGKIRLKHTRDDRETVAIVAQLFRWWNKRWSDHGTFKTVRETDITRVDLDDDQNCKRSVLAQLPGVYYVRSKAAAAHFPSIFRAIIADDRAWRAVPGIGPKTAKRIVEAIRRREKQR